MEKIIFSIKLLIKSYYHLTINISDYEKSLPFYKDLFSYLGWQVVKEGAKHAGFTDGSAEIWLKETGEDYKKSGYHRKRTGVNHLAFRVKTREEVDQFYREFLVPRKISSLYGSPKPFPQYTNKYYAAFFEDPDRLKLEVVCL